MDIGFQTAGFDIVFANDIDTNACNTYDLNHSVKISRGDIRNYKEKLKSLKGTDIVFGGPPCQGFSVAGKMDPKDQRSELIWSFFDTVELIFPKAFVCENVKALAVNSRWDSVRKRLIERADLLGYYTLLIVLNSADYGVPQLRERMFLIGLRKDLCTVQPKMLNSSLINSIHNKRSQPKPIEVLIKKLGSAGSKSNPRTCPAKITFAKNPILRKSPFAGMLFNGAGRPVNSKGLALTLPASMGGNKTPIIDEGEIFESRKSFIVDYHKHLTSGGDPYTGEVPNRLRRLTVDEAIAIQTFPSDYLMSGSQTAVYKQIGNAVPPKLSKVVAETIKEALTQGLNKFIKNNQ